MKHLFESVICKVFRHPKTAGDCGPIRPNVGQRSFVNTNGAALDSLAEDSSGNYFAASTDGAVWFWDHEVGSAIFLAASAPEFIERCISPEDLELDPALVKSAWIDPSFAKSLGVAHPEDGWIKKLGQT